MAFAAGFHPAARFEVSEAVDYYSREASDDIAAKFAEAIESAVSALKAAPTRWRVVEHPEIRRYVLRRFPFAIYYRWEPKHGQIVVYAVMHCSRAPGYWRNRLETDY